MSHSGIHAVTGAFGYSGKHIASRLIQRGYSVVTLTNSLSRPNPFGDRIRALPLAFHDPHQLLRPLVRVSPAVGYALSRFIGWFVRDTFLTREEIRGLMGDLLYVNAPPAGQTRLTDWMKIHAHALGRRYASELRRRFDRAVPYVGSRWHGRHGQAVRRVLGARPSRSV